MPINKSDYPSDWTTISLQVREEAGQRCEWCGAPNKGTIQRRPKHRYEYPGLEGYQVDWVLVTSVNTVKGEERTDKMSWERLKFYGLTRIVLTVAHLDRNSKNNDRDNLAALCQRCHLKHDIHQHIANRRYGRHHAKEQQFKLFTLALLFFLLGACHTPKPAQISAMDVWQLFDAASVVDSPPDGLSVISVDGSKWEIRSSGTHFFVYQLVYDEMLGATYQPTSKAKAFERELNR